MRDSRKLLGDELLRMILEGGRGEEKTGNLVQGLR